jgi:hypothetical protein
MVQHSHLGCSNPLHKTKPSFTFSSVGEAILKRCLLAVLGVVEMGNWKRWCVNCCEISFNWALPDAIDDGGDEVTQRTEILYCCTVVFDI